MALSDAALISALFFLVAIVYSSVGHAGASGYAAILALFSVAPEIMRPTSLILNVVVGSFGLFRFYRAGLIDFKKVFPFLVASTPAAFFSASLNVDKKVFFVLLGILLLLTGGRLLLGAGRKSEGTRTVREIKIPVAMGAGGTIGLCSGLTGTGGAIFFTPLLLGAKWAEPREASGLSVVFVLANSIFGLAGIWSSTRVIDVRQIIIWSMVVLAGALIGTHFGIKKIPDAKLKRILGLVLLVASYKLLSRGF